MTGADRREFLKKLAGGVAYSAPVVYSMTAPMDIVAQSGKGHSQGSAKGHGMGHGKDWGDGGSKGKSGMTTFVPPPGGSPPWGGG